MDITPLLTFISCRSRARRISLCTWQRQRGEHIKSQKLYLIFSGSWLLLNSAQMDMQTSISSNIIMPHTFPDLVIFVPMLDSFRTSPQRPDRPTYQICKCNYQAVVLHEGGYHLPCRGTGVALTVLLAVVLSDGPCEGVDADPMNTGVQVKLAPGCDNCKLHYRTISSEAVLILSSVICFG